MSMALSKGTLPTVTHCWPRQQLHPEQHLLPLRCVDDDAFYQNQTTQIEIVACVGECHDGGGGGGCRGDDVQCHGDDDQCHGDGDQRDGGDELCDGPYARRLCAHRDEALSVVYRPSINCSCKYVSIISALQLTNSLTCRTCI